MAGTGHGYEIANTLELRSFVSDCVYSARLPEASQFFESPRFLRFTTRPEFVFKVRKNASQTFLQFCPEEDRPFVEAKFQGGADVRLFSRSQFDLAGPDVRHVADWFSHLKKTDPRTLAKVSRMSPENLFQRVSRWVPAKGLETTTDGETALLLETSAGHFWHDLRDKAALSNESVRMSHCVGDDDYVSAVTEGRSRILSLRDGVGRSLLTAEFEIDPEEQTCRLVQVRAHANSGIPISACECVCELMNALKSTPQDTHAEQFSRITHAGDAGWRPVLKVWERVEFQGLDAVVSGMRGQIMSPVHPAKPLLSVHSVNGWWLLSSDEIRTSTSTLVTMSDRRAWHRDEIRAVAGLVDQLGCNNPLEHGDVDQRIVLHEGVHRPLLDTLPRSFAGEAEYVTYPDGSHVVHHSKDSTTRLLEIRPDDEDKGIYRSMEGIRRALAWPVNVVRWNETEARRCLAVMSYLKTPEFGRSLGHAETRPLWELFRPVRDGDGNWYPFNLDAVRVPTKHAKSGWMVTPFLLTLRIDEGRRREYDFQIRDGKLTSLPPLGSDETAMKEAAAFLNRRRLRPADACLRTWPARLTGPKRMPALVDVAGRWRIVRTQREFAKAHPEGHVLSEAEVRQAFSLLPDDLEGLVLEVVPLYTRALLHWAEQEIAAGLGRTLHHFIPTYVTGGAALAYRRRVGHLADLADGMDDRQRKTAERFLRNLFDSWTPERLKGMSHSTADVFTDILAKTWRMVPEKTLDRLVGRLFKRHELWISQRPEELLWVRDILPALTGDKARVGLLHAIEGSLPIRDDVAVDRIPFIHSALSAIAASSSSFAYEYRRDLIAAVVSAKEAVPEADRTASDAEIVAGLKAVLSSAELVWQDRQASAARRRREFDEKWFPDRARNEALAA